MQAGCLLEGVGVVQQLSHVQLFVTQASLSFTISWSLLKLMPTESVMLSNPLIFCRLPLLLPLLFPSIRAFSNESALCIITKGIRPYPESIRSSELSGSSPEAHLNLKTEEIPLALVENRREEAKSEAEATRSEPLRVLLSTRLGAVAGLLLREMGRFTDVGSSLYPNSGRISSN